MHTAAPDQAFTSLRALRHTCFSLDGIGVFGKAEIQRLLVKAEVLLDWAHYYGATRQEVAKKHLERAKGCLDEAWEYAKVSPESDKVRQQFDDLRKAIEGWAARISPSAND